MRCKAVAPYHGQKRNGICGHHCCYHLSYSSFQFSVLKLKPKQLLQPITADRKGAISQSEFEAIECNCCKVWENALSSRDCYWFWFLLVEKTARGLLTNHRYTITINNKFKMFSLNCFANNENSHCLADWVFIKVAADSGAEKNLILCSLGHLWIHRHPR